MEVPLRFSQHNGRLNLSLRSKLVLGGILILLVPMSIVGFVTFVKSARTLEDISKLQLVQVAESLSGMIQIALEKDLRDLVTMASDSRIIRDTLAGEYKNTQKKLSELYKLLSADFEGIALYDTDGIIRADGTDEARIGISIAERNYYLAAKEGKTGVGPMVPSKATGAPIFGLSAPIMSPNGKFIGAVLGVVKAEYLTKYIASIKFGKTGYVFMIDQGGTIIAHPNEDLILTTNIMDITEAKGLVDETIRQKAKAVEYTLRGKEKVAGICRVTLTGWSIGACQDKDEIMALAYANMNFLLIISCFFVILIILAVLFFSKTVSAPVQTTLTTLNHVVDQAAEAFLIIDQNGNVQFANPAAAAIFDRPLSDIVGNPFQPETVTSNHSREILKAIREGTVWNGHINGARKDGSRYTIALTITPILSPTGKLMCYLAVGRDITQEIILHEQLQQSHKMEAIGTLAGGIAHDFNNILSAIFGYTELALDSYEDREGLESYLTQILGAAKRARDLVTHILTFSRKAELGRKPMIPKYVIKDTLKLLRASLPSTIEIRESLISSAVVMGNDTQIHQMTMNLCSNAGYAMEESGGILDITLDETTVENDVRFQYPDLKPGRYLRLKVADSGGGISADILERIFEPFFTTKPTGEGTGLGLSVVHGLVKSLEGEIMVTSQIGKGSTFTILLPIVETHIAEPGEAKRKKLPTGTERVLVVDDEEAITRLMRILLEGLGYSVRAFTQSRSALEEFLSHPDAFDVIVTDYTMPKITGVSLAKKIRSIRANIPIILCSGYLTLKDKLEELQPIEFIGKPISSHELAHAMRYVLDRSGET